jgi:hypothetical protein
VAVGVHPRWSALHVRAGLDNHGYTGDVAGCTASHHLSYSAPSTHTHTHTHTRLQFELSHYTKLGSLCLTGGMLALLVAERLLRDFATSTVFESGAGNHEISQPFLCTAHARDCTAGLFTLLVRCLIGAVFLTKMRETISNSASSSREPFLRAFAIAGACFFFILPLLALLLFLFANNCSLARNLTFIAGLSQVRVPPSVSVFFRCCLCSRRHPLQLLGLAGLGFTLWPKAHSSYVVVDEENDNPYDGL